MQDQNIGNRTFTECVGPYFLLKLAKNYGSTGNKLTEDMILSTAWAKPFSGNLVSNQQRNQIDPDLEDSQLWQGNIKSSKCIAWKRKKGKLLFTCYHWRAQGSSLKLSKVCIKEKTESEYQKCKRIQSRILSMQRIIFLSLVHGPPYCFSVAWAWFSIGSAQVTDRPFLIRKNNYLQSQGLLESYLPSQLTRLSI